MTQHFYKKGCYNSIQSSVKQTFSKNSFLYQLETSKKTNKDWYDQNCWGWECVDDKPNDNKNKIGQT